MFPKKDEFGGSVGTTWGGWFNSLQSVLVFAVITFGIFDIGRHWFLSEKDIGNSTDIRDL